jgi:type III secretory pathway component EscT
MPSSLVVLAPHAAALGHGGPSFLEAFEQALGARGIDLPRLGMAWARATPAVTLVPAFGLKALPNITRGVLGITLAVAIFPALPEANPTGGALWLELLTQVALGVPVALAAAIPLWAATMAGGVADALRGANDATAAPTVEGTATPLGIVFSLLACSMFFASGGPSRVAAALAHGALEAHPLLRASADLESGITIAVALGAPLLAASVVLEVAGALIARAATPAQLHLLLAPLRALGLLGVLALVFSRLCEALAGLVAHARIGAS